MADLQAILAHFERVSGPRGDFYKCCCPAHDDQNPSLSIWKSPNGWVTFRCFAGCQERDILAAVGLRKWQCGPPKDGEQGAEEQVREIVATYDYTDEVGKLLFQEVRFEPKSFAFRRPDPSMKDGWDWKIGETRRVLFNLPKLVRYPHCPVIVVEGPGKVLAIEKLDLPVVATCNAGGADGGHGVGKWRDEYSQQLRGRRVVVIPDRDRAGQRHGDQVIGSLIRHGVSSVRLVELVHLPLLDYHGADIKDWLVGRGKEELVGVIRQAVEWKPAEVRS